MKQQAITSLPLSPEVERHNRMIKYSITMGIRIVCILLMFFVHGWWLVACAIGAIVLPWFAVIIANVHSDPRGSQVIRPGGVQVYRPEPFSPGDRDDAGRANAGPTNAGPTNTGPTSAGPADADNPTSTHPAAENPHTDSPTDAR